MAFARRPTERHDAERAHEAEPRLLGRAAVGLGDALVGSRVDAVRVGRQRPERLSSDESEYTMSGDVAC